MKEYVFLGTITVLSAIMCCSADEPKKETELCMIKGTSRKR